jgi:cobalt/nickel transport protein
MRRTSWFILGGLLVALLLAGVVSNFASGAPDGLDSASTKGCAVDAEGEITGGDCMARNARDHELGDSPLADYGIRGVDNSFLSTGLSGVAGVLLTFAVGGGAFWLLRRRTPGGATRRGSPPGRVGSGASPGGADSGSEAEATAPPSRG